METNSVPPPLAPTPQQGGLRSAWPGYSYGLRGAIIGAVVSLVGAFTPLLFVFLVPLASLNEVFGTVFTESSGGGFIAFPSPTYLGFLMIALMGAFAGWFIGSVTGVFRRGPDSGNRFMAIFKRCALMVLGILVFLALPALVAALPRPLQCTVVQKEVREKCYYELSRETGDSGICSDQSKIGSGYEFERCRIDTAVQQGNTQWCANLQIAAKYECISKVAESKKDVSLCDEIPKSETASWNACVTGVAKAAHDPSMCQGIARPTMVNEYDHYQYCVDSAQK